MIKLTKPAFQRLIQQLLYIEETMEDTASFYYLDSPLEQSQLKNFLRQYTAIIEDEFSRIQVVHPVSKETNTRDLNNFPYVVIGSSVVVENLGNGVLTTYNLTHSSDQSRAKNDLWYLSDIGRALLLRELDTEVKLPLQGGLECCRIKSIMLM